MRLRYGTWRGRVRERTCRLRVCFSGVYIVEKGSTHFSASTLLRGQKFHGIRTPSSSSKA